VASHKRISLSDDTAEPMLTVPDPVQATLSVLGCLEVSFCVRPPRPVAASRGKARTRTAKRRHGPDDIAWSHWIERSVTGDSTYLR